ncbi:tannase/feruloyl esterase family alpha/beta hydrolase [Croceibacterium xixiisoli]|nr:tannase/feruloyl esterase family alpha/beta hydrolase [Croceibacterium xixiisoli]
MKQGAVSRAMRKAMFAGAGASALFAVSPAAAANCGDLVGTKIASGTVTAAGLVAPGAFQQPSVPGGPPPGVLNAAYSDLPQFCRVQATLKPSSDSDIKVEIWLPARGWNGKYVGIGNGIWAGQLSYSQLADPLKRGYAVATTDTGHTGNGLTAEWAIGHPEKLVDFGHRAIHEMTVAAKQAITAIYGKGPEVSFWNSCSTGGRQGLMSAHRYPEDYDVISSMAPANPMTDLMTQTMWAGYQPQREPGAALTMGKLTSLHRAAVAQCDKDDGVEDGLIGRPDSCRFDPATIQCTAGDSDSCLTAPQVKTAQALYDGIRNAEGHLLLPGWPRGAEMQLAALVMADKPFPVAYTYFSMLVFDNRADWDWKGFDYTRDLQRSRDYGASILNAPSDGLGPFFARGGKLLLSHGWADGLIPANNTLGYYQHLYYALPRAQAQQQLRLFMAPGMDHCSGGAGPSDIDTLGIMDEWARSGNAPDRILAVRPTKAPSMPGAPEAPAREPMSRPLCAWPMVAQYKGTGSSNEAANFTCVNPDA